MGKRNKGKPKPSDQTGTPIPSKASPDTEANEQEQALILADDPAIRQTMQEILSDASKQMEATTADVGLPDEMQKLLDVANMASEPPSEVMLNGPSRYPGPVLLVGSGSNIGFELARRLVGDGATVILSYHSDPSRVIPLQLANPDRVLASLALDVRAERSIERFFRQLQEQTKKLYAVINTIGPMIYRPLDQLTVDDMETMLHTNTLQAFSIAQKAKPLLRKCGRGRLVHFTHAGIEQLRGYRFMGGYSPSKAALLSLSRSLAMAWANEGITVNTIGPGIVETAEAEYGNLLKKIPQGRLTTVNDLYRAVLYFLDPDNNHVTGNNLDVSGGFGLI